MTTSYWPDEYIDKRRTAEEAMQIIRSGQRVFFGSSCAEPQHLANTLIQMADHFSDLEIVRLMSLTDSPITKLANENPHGNFNIRNIYHGSASATHLAPSKPYITPINISAVPGLFLKRQLPLNAAFVQTSPPDDFGWMSLGISVDICLAAIQSADLVIAQVNPKMPRVLGQSFIHVNDVDVVVEKEEELLTIDTLPEFETAHKIAQMIANLVEDGSTFQLGLGATPKAILLALADKNDLGVHTQFIINGIMDLVSVGVITNKYKGIHNGKLVASNAVGSKNLYEFIHDNPSIEFYPSDYVNNPGIIAQHNKMVAVNMVMEMDLTGQAAVDALPNNYFAGVSSMIDFVRGSALSNDGKSILLIPSTSIDGEESRIVSAIDSGGVVIPRGDVSYVVSEFGAVNLFGKNLQERATAMISLAHPKFRDELFAKAKELGLMSHGRQLSESLTSVYPAGLEEIRKYGDQDVQLRPAKPVDERRIQEHFYNLDKKDVVARFFHEKTCFIRDDVECMFETDYIKNLTILAVTGEFGFGEVVGIGAYMIEPKKNIAEVAFSVTKKWQGKGIASALLFKLAQAAKDNGISGLVAYTSPENSNMIKLFKKLPYPVKSSLNDGMMILTCSFTNLNEQ
ncbi:MAG: GNAT family N-acetyltransferase [Desulfobacteraceae bacterium]|nr:GNAT family N-acetyltransferase [Desulfobacteraceae bacterium]MBC2757776.1 GNAT family N-acetyltransferase [Desulfobacteraceae bacterium]MBC2763864.1 GNAT family N-acetyltransferase [ANME-2 cluster archaeon]